MKPMTHYPLLADLFRYPGIDFLEKLKKAEFMLETDYPEAAVELKRFSEYMNACTQDEREELYTKTFDVQPICYLDLGYVIFGEDYKRGAFLVHMQEEQEKAGNDCGSDLADNLVNILTLFVKNNDPRFITELVHKIMIPGIDKMIAEFESARVDLKMKVIKKLHKAIIQEDLNQGNVYRNAFEALKKVFITDFGLPPQPEVKDVAGESFRKSFLERENTNELVNNYKLD